MSEAALMERSAPVPKPASAGSHSRWGAESDVFDVLVIGAGISGIGAGYHLRTQCPWARYITLEAQETFGGTWLTHKYPGIRSDSDLYTFGYRFKPWEGAPIASAEEINRYLREVIEEHDLERHIRYGHKVTRCDWSSEEKLWTVQARRNDTGEALVFRTRFVWACQGYYKHDRGYTPEWQGMGDFKGRIVHPQTWPKDLDYTGKRVVVIGSGATAATLIPNMAPTAGHVTMLQRSPTWFVPGRNVDDLADQLRALEIDPIWIHEIVRRQRLKTGEDFTKRAREEEDTVKQELLAGVKAFLGADFDVATHFTPRYRPWRQRIAFVPDGDLFQSIASGKASVETGEIDRFVESGILLKSGKVLEADIIVTATGFELSVMGDIPFSKDGQPIDWGQTVTYRGMMFTGVPNLVWIFGYFRASWTLRVDLIADFVCRLLEHMRQADKASVEPQLPSELADAPRLPWIDPEDFNPGYLMRDMDRLPKRAPNREWGHTQDYWGDRRELPSIDLSEAVFHYG